MSDISLVCQGPIPSDDRDRSLVFASIALARKQFGIRTVLSTWENSPLGEWADKAFDEVVFSPDPGPSWFNIDRQSYSTMAGLERVSGRTIKTRTDIVLSRRFLSELRQPTIAQKKIVTTNLFTRLTPYHLSDMVLVSEAEILKAYFAVDDRTSGMVCEQRFSLNLAMNSFPTLFATYGTHNWADGWQQFMAENVTVWDFEAANLTWLKVRNIRDHSDWKFAPSVKSGTPWRGELVLGEKPFSTEIRRSGFATAIKRRIPQALRPALRKLRRVK